MRNVDDIRQVLLDHEVFAPDGAGLVEAARAGAVRVRRRRRLTVAAAVVVALVVPVALVAVFRDMGAVDSAVVPASPPYRSTLQSSVGVDPGSGYSVLEYWVNRDRQQFTLRPPGGVDDVTVVVHNPGTFAPTRGGEPVAVGPRSARYLLDLDLGRAACWNTPDGVRTDPGLRASAGSCRVRGEEAGPVRMPAVGWREPSGAWVVVFIGVRSTRVDLLTAASAVRIGPPTGIRAPFRLGYVPAGLAAAYASGTGSGPRQPGATVALDPPDADPVTGADNATGWMPSIDTALTITANVRMPYTDEKAAELDGPTKIAGLDTYYTDRDTGAWIIKPGSAVLVVVSGHCHIGLTVHDKARVPYAELVRTVENATFLDCADPATWTTPLT